MWGESSFISPKRRADLSRVNDIKTPTIVCAGLLYIRSMDPSEKVFQMLEMPFSTPSAAGGDIPLSSRYRHVTADNRQEYVRLALNYRYLFTY